MQLALTAGQAHDNKLAGRLLSRLKSGTMLLADRGYDADWIRALVTKGHAWANIPPRSNRSEPICFSPLLYRARNLVKRFFNKIKQYRRIATRYDKLAANYLAFIQLASIRLWLRVNRDAQSARWSLSKRSRMRASESRRSNARSSSSEGFGRMAASPRISYEKLLHPPSACVVRKILTLVSYWLLWLSRLYSVAAKTGA